MNLLSHEGRDTPSAAAAAVLRKSRRLIGTF
jgi:hypothetical protein